MKANKLRIQAVLYDEDSASIKRSLESLVASVPSIRALLGDMAEITIAYGDASEHPLFSDEDLAAILAEIDSSDVSDPACCMKTVRLEYCYFDENTGYGLGHDKLAAGFTEGYLLLINPDIIVAPGCVERLLQTALSDPKIGAVEARQTPIENPKEYNRITGDTEWACGACLLVDAALFAEVGGFDYRTFFMYCEDVDLSWSILRNGRRVVYRPDAVAYHPKHLSLQGGWLPTATEQYHSILSGLALAYKWNNTELLARLEDHYERNGGASELKALIEFHQRISDGTIPAPLDDGMDYATFHEDRTIEYRFTY